VKPRDYLRKAEAEGGCGVIGIACAEPIQGRHLLQSLIQMRNRGNGKGGGAALAGIDPASLGVSRQLLATDYLVAVAYLDESAQTAVETEVLDAAYEIDQTHTFPVLVDLEPTPPKVVVYFARPRLAKLAAFAEQSGLTALEQSDLEDEYVYQTSYRLNTSYYASLGEKRAFVLSHGKDLLALKLVGYGDDVFHVYGLEDFRAHVWIGHHRYPTKGTIWHPGGAHPFVGLHEALVHNGDFANYASVCSYLAQHSIRPLFLTDTEVSVLVFDLLHRTFAYPLEYVIEALAPTTERDFAMLPAEKREIYRALQASHMHGSPDGPWFFLLAQSIANGAGPREARLLGITDTSMLRPQVFALQQGEPAIGFAASEKQAIDAALKSLSEADSRFWSRPDLVWNARGGSHTDGGAFLFSVVRDQEGATELHCRDKFGRRIEIEEASAPLREPVMLTGQAPSRPVGSPKELFSSVVDKLQEWDYSQFQAFLGSLLNSKLARADQLQLLAWLIDRRYPTGQLRRSSVLTIVDRAILEWANAVRETPDDEYKHHGYGDRLPEPDSAAQSIVVDAEGFAAQGRQSLAIGLQELVSRGFTQIVVINTSGQRFIANGIGPQSNGVRVDVFGSSGDYLASGIDGMEVIVHGSAQDQLAQIMKAGRLVVHGDVGQTFMYGAKGGDAFVLGNAAGRPLINAVGKPRVVINGTCLDYLAESFMAGDPLNGGGFVVLNGVVFNAKGELTDLDSPYPGGNLFSLASGGAVFVRDPARKLGKDQLNSGDFTQFSSAHWEVVRPILEENERHFGIPIDRLLQVNGSPAAPQEIYRAIFPSGIKALQPEQAWIGD
jgi:glutamate synthase domain-containing protein 1/glutamate synthase domain-containing protein 3